MNDEVKKCNGIIEIYPVSMPAAILARDILRMIVSRSSESDIFFGSDGFCVEKDPVIIEVEEMDGYPMVQLFCSVASEPHKNRIIRSLRFLQSLVKTDHVIFLYDDSVDQVVFRIHEDRLLIKRWDPAIRDYKVSRQIVK